MMRQQDLYPRLLVINGDALNQGLGTGTTVGSLFAGWPKDKLAQLYLNRTEIRGDAACSKTWRLEFVKDRVPGLHQIKTSWRRPTQSRMKQIARAGRGGAGSTATSWDFRARGVAIANMRGAVRTMLDSVPYQLNSHLLNDIHAFAPQVIYSCIGNIQLVALVDRLSQLEGAATVVHLMDDWLATKHADSWIWAWHRYKLVNLSRKLIKRCSVSLAISDKMAQEYEAVFGRPFGVFMNCVEVNPDEPALPECHPDAPVRFVYVGGLHLGRWQSLLEIGEALDGMAGERPHGRLILHAPAADLASYMQGRRMPRCIEVAGPVPPSEVRPVLRRADVMVHVESFGRAERRFTRLSISTKIPQYMSVGRPILAYGPGEVASCQYVNASGSGVVVGRQDRLALTEALRRLCSDADLRAGLGRQAWLTALEKHNAQTVRERFRMVLADAAQTCGGGADEPACVPAVAS
jgi:glycosyltransferase involved in cell wall biosynthesis